MIDDLEPGYLYFEVVNDPTREIIAIEAPIDKDWDMSHYIKPLYEFLYKIANEYNNQDYLVIEMSYVMFVDGKKTKYGELFILRDGKFKSFVKEGSPLKCKSIL